MTGVIMDESPTGCWTVHHSVIQFKNQWYLFYHDRDYSPNFDKARSVRVDSLFFNEDGTIRKVIPTLRGPGLTAAAKEIQIDRYSKKSDEGVSVDFLDTLDRFKGWKTTFNKSNAWIQYNSVDFGKKPLKAAFVRIISDSGGILQVHTNNINGPVIAEIKIPKSTDWKIAKTSVVKFQAGVQNLFVTSKNNDRVEVDWIKFE
jgi:hypothetical protein